MKTHLWFTCTAKNKENTKTPNNEQHFVTVNVRYVSWHGQHVLPLSKYLGCKLLPRVADPLLFLFGLVIAMIVLQELKKGIAKFSIKVR